MKKKYFYLHAIIILLTSNTVFGMEIKHVANKEADNGHTNLINSLALNADNTIIASGSDDRTIQLRSTNDLELYSSFNCNEIVSCLTFINNEELAAGLQSGTIQIWDTKTNKSIILNEHTRNINSLAYNHNSEKPLLASGSNDETLKIWDLSTNTVLFSLKHHYFVTAVAFSDLKNDPLLVSGTQSGHIATWNIATGEKIKEIKENIPILSLILPSFYENAMIVSFGKQASRFGETCNLYDDQLNQSMCFKNLQKGANQNKQFMHVSTFTSIQQIISINNDDIPPLLIGIYGNSNIGIWNILSRFPNYYCENEECPSSCQSIVGFPEKNILQLFPASGSKLTKRVFTVHKILKDKVKIIKT